MRERHKIITDAHARLTVLNARRASSAVSVPVALHGVSGD